MKAEKKAALAYIDQEAAVFEEVADRSGENRGLSLKEYKWAAR